MQVNTESDSVKGNEVLFVIWPLPAHKAIHHDNLISIRILCILKILNDDIMGEDVFSNGYVSFSNTALVQQKWLITPCRAAEQDAESENNNATELV